LKQKENAHSASWLTVAELQAADYDQLIEDRRCNRRMPAGYTSGSQTGEGVTQALREFLGREYFEELEKLAQVGAERVVFWFDN
jgi:hypothetical protein